MIISAYITPKLGVIDYLTIVTNLQHRACYCTMIPPVRTVPVWGRAQFSPVQMEGWTGLDHRLPVLDWTGSVWTSPHTLTNSTSFHSQVSPKTSLMLTFDNHSPLNTRSGRNYDSSVCIFGTIEIYFSH